MLKNYLLNLRPYSWIDLVLLGFLAKFSTVNNLSFDLTDFYFILGLLFLWFFFNLMLEFKHNYEYRGRVSVVPPLVFLVLALVIGLLINYLSVIFVVLSAIFVFIYVQKSKNRVLGNLSCVIRGLIEFSYFFFALTFFTASFTNISIVLGVMVFLIYAARALVGDIRDVKHNKEAGKKTFPVTFGVVKCKAFVIILLLISVILQVFYFDSYLISVPLVLFILSLFFYSNGYVLHQLMVLTASFFHINMISFFTFQSLILMNLIYLGIFLNLIFYPLLERKSNPRFMQ